MLLFYYLLQFLLELLYLHHLISAIYLPEYSKGLFEVLFLYGSSPVRGLFGCYNLKTIFFIGSSCRLRYGASKMQTINPYKRSIVFFAIEKKISNCDVNEQKSRFSQLWCSYFSSKLQLFFSELSTWIMEIIKLGCSEVAPLHLYRILMILSIVIRHI